MRSGSFPALALGLVVLAAFIVFFPTLFFGRVISPLDTIANSPPWSGVRPPVQVSNPDLEAPATVALPAVAAVERDGAAIAVWDPYRGAGRPGWLALGSQALSPFVAPFIHWMEHSRILNASTLAKLLTAYWFTWLLLRRRGRSESGAALGALAFAMSAPLAMGWLRPGGGAAALLPMLMWVIDRTSDNRWAVRAAFVGAVWLVFLLAGPLTSALVGGYLAAAWLAFRNGPTDLRSTSARAAAALTGVAAATLAIAPSICLRSCGPSGLSNAPAAHVFQGWGTAALRLLVDPFVFGDPRLETFAPPQAMSGLAFHEVCVTVGWLTIVLALFGALTRGRDRRFWLAAGAVALGSMALTPLGDAIGILPGLSRLTPTHIGPIVALAFAALASAGWDALVRPLQRRHAAVGTVLFGTAIALQLGLLSGHLLTYLPTREASFRVTPGLQWLFDHSDPGDRVAPLFRTLPGDTAAAYGLEDIRTNSGTVPGYRGLLASIDPQIAVGSSDPVLLNGATIDLRHPYLAALGARWVLEPPDLNLVEYALREGIIQSGPRMSSLGRFRRGSHIVQELILPPQCSRLGVPVRSTGAGSLTVELRLTALADSVLIADTVATVEEDAGELALWLELPPAGNARSVRLHVAGRAGKGELALRRVAGTRAGVGALLDGGTTRPGALGLLLDTSGYVLAYEGPDVRIWESRTALPRAWMASRIVSGGLDAMLGDRPPTDLSTMAVVADESELPAGLVSARGGGAGTVDIEAAAKARLELTATAARPAMLVTSIAAHRSLWRARVDGEAARLLTVDGVFLGLPLSPGRHHVVLSARLPAGWIVTGGFGAGILLVMFAAAIGTRRSGDTT